jgi:hypothetical protein
VSAQYTNNVRLVLMTMSGSILPAQYVNFRLLVSDTSMHTQKPCGGGTTELNHIVYNLLHSLYIVAFSLIHCTLVTASSIHFSQLNTLVTMSASSIHW